MISVTNNFKDNYEDLMCPRCKKEIHDEKHLFTECEKLADIQNKYNMITLTKCAMKVSPKKE